MASPRKNYSRLPDQILREDLKDATLADLVRLAAYLNQRWARDGLTPDEAEECALSSQEAMLVTNTSSPRSARRRLLALTSCTPFGELHAEPVHAERAWPVRVRWHNFTDVQGYRDRPHPNSGQFRGDRAPENAPSEKRREEKRRKEEREAAPDGDSLTLKDCLSFTGWSEEQKTRWLDANLPKIKDSVDATRPRDRNAAIRAKVRAFAKAERNPPTESAKIDATCDDPVAEAWDLARRRLQVEHLSESAFKAHVAQFPDVFSRFFPHGLP